MVGPTASMLPTGLFSKGVTMLGGIQVTKADELLDIISEGGSGYHSSENMRNEPCFVEDKA